MERDIEETIEAWFTYHAPDEVQRIKLQKIRDGAKAFALTLAENTFRSADQTAAFRKLRECVMTANASIVLEGRL